MSRKDPIYEIAGKPCPVVSQKERDDGQVDIRYVYHQDLMRESYFPDDPVPGFEDASRTGGHVADKGWLEALPRKEWTWDDAGNIYVQGGEKSE